MSKNSLVSFYYLKIFIIAVVVLIVFSLLYRMGTQYLNSSFRNNSFTVLYLSNDSKILSIDKKNKTLVFLSVGNIKEYIKGKSTFEAGIALGIPLNAIIVNSKNHAPRNIEELVNIKNELRFIFQNDDTSLRNLNYYDIYKFINTSRGISRENRREGRINLFDNNDVKTIKDDFKDSVIAQMPYTIEVVNGTSINGLGGQVAYILGLAGFNVISVRTSPEDGGSYIAATINNNGYIKSLKGLVNMPLKKEKISQTADVTVFLGNDLESSLNP